MATIKKEEYPIKEIMLMDTNGDTKMLLLKDLCSRLPYGVMVNVNGNNEKVDEINPFEGLITCGFQYFVTEECKPYLRPMPSMTKDEKKEYHELCDYYYGRYFNTIDSINWLLGHHFDYRGLIEKGLAIAMTEENNPYKE